MFKYDSANSDGKLLIGSNQYYFNLIGKMPMLYVDVNISEGVNQRIVIYEGDKTEEIVDTFAIAHGSYNINCMYLKLSKGLTDDMKKKLRILLDLQIRKVLSNIEGNLFDPN